MQLVRVGVHLQQFPLQIKTEQETEPGSSCSFEQRWIRTHYPLPRRRSDVISITDRAALSSLTLIPICLWNLESMSVCESLFSLCAVNLAQKRKNGYWCLVDYFITVTMILGSKSYSVDKPVFHALKWCRICREYCGMSNTGTYLGCGYVCCACLAPDFSLMISVRRSSSPYEEDLGVLAVAGRTLTGTQVSASFSRRQAFMFTCVCFSGFQEILLYL